MKKTVRLFCVLLAIFTLLSFAACSAGAPEEAPSDGMNNVFPSYDDSLVQGGVPGKDDSPIVDAEEGIPNTPDTYPEAPPEEGTYDGDDEFETKDAEESESDAALEPPDANVVDLISNPFVRVDENPFSTFSADVDTASYTYFRKLATSGYDWTALRNSGSAFRTEEFINYFRYDVPEAREGELFGVYSELVPCPWNSGSMIFRMTLEAPEAPESQGNNLVFLIDVSGSMSSDDKLPLLKRAFTYLVENLTQNDTVSIVTYSGREAVVLDGAHGGDTQKILDAINSLKSSGSTNGEAGLTMAYRLAEKHFISGGNNRIIMASDGDLNVGISSASELTKYIEEKRDQGVYLSVLGFGTGNYRDDRMEALADNGNGVYYYIDGESEAEKVFGKDLMGTLYTVAKDVKLQIEFNADWVEEYRLIGYDNRVLDKEDFENDQKDAGEVGASHQVTVVYEIKLKESDMDTGIPKSLMTFRVRYKNPDEVASRLNEYTLGLNDMYRDLPTTETGFILSVVKAASLLRNRDYNGDITIRTIAAELEAMQLSKSEMAEFREIVKSLVK